MARIMRPEEIPRTYGRRALWLEAPGQSPRLALYKGGDGTFYDFVVSERPETVRLEVAEYGRKYRVWSRLPDEMELYLADWPGEEDEHGETDEAGH